MRASDPAGRGVVELAVALATLGITVAGIAPEWVEWRDRQRVEALGRRIATEIVRLRARAAHDGRTRALAFERETGAGLCWRVLGDGDGDGIRLRDLRAGRDRIESRSCAGPEIGPVELGAAAGGPGVGPGSTRIPADGISFPGDRVSIGPGSTGSTGTVYLGGPGGWTVAVRQYGPTGRVRLWLYDRDRESWRRR